MSIEQTIKQEWAAYTPAEQKLASFFLAHLQELPYETAASIGRRLGVSPMTVGRYIRKLGYSDFNQIKDALRAEVAETGRIAPPPGAGFAPATLQAAIHGLTRLHELPQSAEWAAIVRMLANAGAVRVASFQVGRFLGLGFATFLANMRPRASFCDGADGAYGEVLLDPDPTACLVLIDFRRYSRHFRLLGEEAAARGVPLVIITDVYCHWARELTPHVLMIETDFGIRSLSMAQLLFELLLAAVADALGDTAGRVEQLHALRQKFVGFVGPG